MYRLLLTSAAALLAGCAAKPTVTENQCRAGDWQTIGYRDGANGVASTRLLAHQEACGEFGIVPERSGYLAGWREGVLTYCTADSGFRLGMRGGAFNSICSGELREPFATAHADGLEIYGARQELSRARKALSQREQRLVTIKEEIVGATAAQLEPELTAEARLRLLAKLEALTTERQEIKNELPVLEDAVLQAEDRLAVVERTVAYR